MLCKLLATLWLSDTRVKLQIAVTALNLFTFSDWLQVAEDLSFDHKVIAQVAWW